MLPSQSYRDSLFYWMVCVCRDKKIWSLNHRRSFVNFTRYFVHINWKSKQKRWNINVGDTEVIHVSSSHYGSRNFLHLRNSLAYHRWQTLNIIQRQSKLDQILSQPIWLVGQFLGYFVGSVPVTPSSCEQLSSQPFTDSSYSMCCLLTQQAQVGPISP